MTVDEFKAEWLSDIDYITAHTSGSTGVPKIIKLPKALVRSSALRTLDYFGIDSDSRLHLCLSPDYIAGKMMIVRAVIAGCTLSSEEPSNYPLRSMSGESDISIDLLAVVPSQIPFLLRESENLPEIRNLLVGGSSIPDVIRTAVIASGINAFESYGMTETASHVAIRRISDYSGYFHALSGIRFSIDDRDCLRIISDDFDIVTNDVVELISEEEFKYIGRNDNTIVCGGIKIHPEEVEKIISPFIDRQFYITGKKHSFWGEIPVLVINGYIRESDRQLLLQKCRSVSTDYGYPKEIICTKFEFTSSGKIKRQRFS